MKWDVDDRLALSAESMRELGYLVVDIVAENLATLAERPVSLTGSRPELEAALREPPPAGPRAPDEVLEIVRDVVLENMIHVDHPRNFGFVPGPGNYVGALADFLTSGFNVFAGTWLEASGPAQIEIVTIDWLKELCGLPGSARGLFVSGGSAANLTSLMIARQEKLPDGPAGGVAYCSDQTHSSMERAFRILGFTARQVSRIETDSRYRLSLEALQKAIDADRADGKKPFCVVANAGTTNTGAVDPLPELSELCRREDLWLHADGAYGAVAVLSPTYRHRLEGLGYVDSLSLDPHKWLFQPYEIGCVLVRDGELLSKHLEAHPEYLQDVKAGEEEVNFCDLGFQLTRQFRALKLWMTIQLFGLDHIRAAIERGIRAAEAAEGYARGYSELEVVSAAELGVVSFRYLAKSSDDLNAFNLELSKAVIVDSFCLASSTELNGKVVLRMCTINPRTTDDDLRKTVERIVKIGRRLDGS